MKRFVQALVGSGAVAAVAAAACAVTNGGVAHAGPRPPGATPSPAPTPAPGTALPVAKLGGDVALTRSSRDGRDVRPARFHVNVRFGTDTPGAEPFTLQRAVIYFPDHAGTSGRLFRACDAQRLAELRGAVNRCPKGSLVGSGTVTASAIQLNVVAPGRVTLFNSHGGDGLTFHFDVKRPAEINEAVDGQLTQLHGGKYGEKLTLAVPPSLQEVIPGVFVGVRTIDVTISASLRSRGLRHSYLNATTCPTSAMHGVFDFKNFTTGQTATAVADAKVRCTGAHR
jgi:hypothetical protein